MAPNCKKATIISLLLLHIFVMATSSDDLTFFQNYLIHQNNRDTRSLVNNRYKIDQAYTNQLEKLVIPVQNILQNYGITEPQCQLKAICEIHKKKSNEKFTNLVGEIRREMENPRNDPIYKRLFQYYKDAAEHGEQQKDCQERYSMCPKYRILDIE